MLRKTTDIALFVSFIAMATSGMLMFVIERPSFTIQMHPVHKLFGLVMTAAAIVHIILNWRSIMLHIRTASMKIFGAALVVALVVMYGVAINNSLPPDMARQLDGIAAQRGAR